MNIETRAVGEVMKLLSRTRYLVPFLNTNDTGPVWDGYVAVYSSAEKTVDSLLLRLPVQIKGQRGATDEETISYPVRLADLRQYPRENPTAYFVVRMDKDAETVYYHAFQKEEAEGLAREKGGQETVSVRFQRLPPESDAVEKLFFALLSQTAPAPETWTPKRVLSDTDVFLYNAKVVGFFGRDEELKRLDAFLQAPGAFRWWGVTAPGGSGKTRLGYEWSRKVEGWTVISLKAGDYKRLDALTQAHPEPLLLIADYARQHTKELGEWMETLCDTESDHAVRLLLLERDEGLDAAGEAKWEQELYLAGNEVHLRRARHEKLLRLPALKDKPLLDLMRAFAAALQKRDATLPALEEAQADGLLQKLNEIDPELRRPLYAMILTDAYLRDPQAASWTREELLEQLVTREREQLKKAVLALQGKDKRLDTALYYAALSLRRLATALGASGDRELKGLLALDRALEALFAKKAEQYNLASAEELLLYLGLLRSERGRWPVPALRPDLLGEFALLHWAESCGAEEARDFYAVALQDWELSTFYQRLYADYAPLLNGAPQRWEKLLPDGLTLDDARASRYSDLLYDGFSRCTDRAQRLRLLRETVRLADAIREESYAAGNLYNNLGLLFYAMGDYPRAINYYQRALAICRKTLGKEHPDSATNYNNLGAVYDDMGDYPRALEQYRKALAICRKTLGEEHPNTAAICNNLGEVYRAMGDNPRALEQYQRALAIYRKTLGEEHPYTATNFDNLGVVYDAMGDNPRALEQHQRALAIRRKTLGEEHPSMATSCNNLGAFFYKRGDYPRAKEYMEKAVEIFERVLGSEHPNTKVSRKWLEAINLVIALEALNSAPEAGAQDKTPDEIIALLEHLFGSKP